MEKRKKTVFVSFASQKGGVGKSTFAIYAASWLHYVKGLNVAIVDCDYPQHSIIKQKKRDMEANNGWNKTSSLSFINMPILLYSDEIRSAVLMLHGEKAHSRYFSEDAFKKLKGGNKELLIIPDASHVDLYDNLNVIPFDRIERFFREYLKWKILVGS